MYLLTPGFNYLSLPFVLQSAINELSSLIIWLWAELLLSLQINPKT
jgi:hypothetical protein